MATRDPAEVIREIAQAWRPPDRIDVATWAERNRVLTSKASAAVGGWRNRPYQVEPMQAFTDPDIEVIVMMVARQTLKTEVILNCQGYAIDQEPGPMLCVQVRDKDCGRFTRIRFDPMVEATPCLKRKVSRSKSRSGENTAEYKEFPGGHMLVVSSSQPANLAATPIRYVFADEVSKYPQSAGNAGKPLALAMGRMEEFWNRKAVLASTPTVEGACEIADWYNRSDKREWHFRCARCNRLQKPDWKQVRYEKDLPPLLRAESVRYQCIGCGDLWDDVARWQASNNGAYVRTGPPSRIAGFWCSGIARVSNRLSSMVEEYLYAEEDPEAMRTFKNEQLAELWRQQGEVLDHETLFNRREGYRPGMVPPGGLLLVAGADVQRADGGRIEVEILACGRNRETWSVGYRRIYGNPAEPEVWQKLEKLLHESWPHANGGALKIERLFVDSGDGTTTRDVYEWVRSQPQPLVWAIKGDSRSDVPVTGPTATELTAEGQRATSFGAILRRIKTEYFKAGLLADLRKKPPNSEDLAKGVPYPQGYCHFPVSEDYPVEYFKQLTAERQVLKRMKSGRTKVEWEQHRPRNEALDARVYALAAAWDYGVHHFQADHWDMLEQMTKGVAVSPTPKPKAPEWLGDFGPGGKRGSWL